MPNLRNSNPNSRRPSIDLTDIPYGVLVEEEEEKRPEPKIIIKQIFPLKPVNTKPKGK